MENKLELITNKKFNTFLIKSINSVWNNTRNGDNTFPSAQPVSLERKNFEKLKKYNYFVTRRTKIHRCILYFITDKNGENQTVLINKNMQVFNINMVADSSIYYGTIFDGEFDVDENTFFIHDSPLICSNKINKNHFSDRIEEIRCCIQNTVDREKCDIKLCVKKFYPMTDIISFKQQVPECKLEGMVFIPDSLPVISGTQYSMFMWRPVEEYSFDFQVFEESDDIVIKVYNMGQMINYAKIHSSIEEGHDCIKQIKSFNNYKDGCIIRFSFSEIFKPMSVITEKTYPNSLRTIERTLFNIHENITFEEFE